LQGYFSGLSYATLEPGVSKDAVRADPTMIVKDDTLSKKTVSFSIWVTTTLVVSFLAPNAAVNRRRGVGTQAASPTLLSIANI
jgi:hypothetical protein